MSKKGDTKNASKKVKELTKIAEDKTFGMKNKNKSKQVQKVVQQIATQQKGGFGKLQEDIFREKQLKIEKEEELRLLAEVFAKTVAKPIITQSGEEIIICQLFKAGLCQKGKKCKLSHNVPQDAMKSEKMDLYVDQREQMFGNKDSIENWDSEKLNEVVDYNDAKYNAPNRTEKPCKHFLEAVEKKTYGWLWICPNGYNCIFRHCLPPDYQFKNAKPVVKEEEDQDDVINEIDNAREKLDTKKLTPVTKELFSKWLEKRTVRREKEREDKAREELKRLGVKIRKNMTGRELFQKDSNLFQDADDAVDEYKREEIPQEEQDNQDQQTEINTDVFADEEVPDIDE